MGKETDERGTRDDSNGVFKGKVQEVGNERPSAASTLSGEGTDDSGVCSKPFIAWFVVIPDFDTSVHRASKGYDFEESALIGAKNRIIEGHPYVYVGCVVLDDTKRMSNTRLVERKPNAEGVSDE